MVAMLLLCLLADPAFPQTARVTAALGKTTVYRGLAMSPDGKSLAWTQALASQGGQEKLWTRIGDGAPVPAPISGPHSETDPAWSPDSRTLAFFSTAGEKDQSQLWTLSGEGQLKKWTHLKGYAARPRWSPDGKRIAFLYIEGAGGGGPLYAAPTQTGVIDQEIRNQRIAVLDVTTGKVSMVSPADLHVYDFDWSPDSDAFAVTAAPGPGDNNWWIAQLYVVRDGVARSVYKPRWQIAIPRWAPDGKRIAFLGDSGIAGVLCISAESAWKHRAGRGVQASEHQGFRRRRSARHPHRCGRGHRTFPD